MHLEQIYFTALEIKYLVCGCLKDSIAENVALDIQYRLDAVRNFLK